MIGAQPVLGRIRLPAGDRQIAPAAVARAGRGHHHRITAVGHHIGRTQRPQRIEHDAGVGALDFGLVLGPLVGFGPDGRGRNVARRPFLQQQLGRFDDRIAVEAVAQAALEDRVGDRRDRHARVVRHVVQHDGVVGAFRHALRREIDRIVEAVAAERADRAQPGAGSAPLRAG